jgi:AcrR family transcriptional regulator
MTTEPDPRVARTTEVVLAATVELLAEVGVDRITIDAIAERSGVARSTVYRNWPDRSELLAQGFRRLFASSPADLEPSGSLAQDLRALGRLLVGQVNGEAWKRAVPSLIGAVDEPAMQQLVANICRERRLEAMAILTRAIEDDEIEPTDQLESAMERFVAPFFIRRLMSHEPLDEAFVEAQVQATLAQLGASSV